MIKLPQLGLFLKFFKEMLEADFAKWCGDHLDALKHYDLALALKERLSNAPDATSASINLSKGRILSELKLHEEAIAALTQASEIAMAVATEPTLMQAICLFELSTARSALGCRFGARQSLIMAESIIDRSNGRLSMHHFAIVNALVSLLRGEPNVASEQLERFRRKARTIGAIINGERTMQRLTFGRL